MLQETLMAAWRGNDGFEDTPFPEGSKTADSPWIEPYPDGLLGDLEDGARGPDARYTAREAMSLAFVAALQHLPPRRRAAFVLCDVLGFRTAEAADILDCSTEAVETALAGARVVITAQLPPGWRDQSPLPGSAREREVAARFADAFERGDVDGIVTLLTDDARLTAPPLPIGYRGRAAAEFLLAVPFRGGMRRVRLIATRANGQPAFGYYMGDPADPVAHAHGLIVLTLNGDRISGITRFMDENILRLFGLPRTLPGWTPLQPGSSAGWMES
jgi:RNA polymerase sigma-70 factor (ECF subfamily)